MNVHPTPPRQQINKKLSVATSPLTNVTFHICLHSNRTVHILTPLAALPLLQLSKELLEVSVPYLSPTYLEPPASSKIILPLFQMFSVFPGKFPTWAISLNYPLFSLPKGSLLYVSLRLPFFLLELFIKWLLESSSLSYGTFLRYGHFRLMRRSNLHIHQSNANLIFPCRRISNLFVYNLFHRA